MTTTLRLIGYKRVSGRSQVDGFGLDVQEDDINRYAASIDAVIVGWCADEGISGTAEVTDRPGLACAIDAIRAGEADGVIFSALDRIARSLTVQEATLGLIWQAGGRSFVATGEVLADDPDDPMRTAIRQVMGVMAQLDRATIALRLRKAREKKAAEGGYAGGAPGYGKKAVDRDLVVDEVEAEVLALVKDLKTQGMTLREISNHLTINKVPTKRGGAWYPTTVARMLGAKV